MINVHIATYVVQTITLQKDVHQNQTRETVEINELIEKLFYNCKILLDAICISCFKYKFVYFFGKKHKQSSAHHQQ